MKLTDEVIETLKTVQVRGNTTIMPQMDRPRYVAVNKALELLGGKWNRSAKAHVWDCDPNEPLADAVATGEVRDWKKEFQFFETPPELAIRMVSFLPRNEMRVLEPSAGRGAIIRALRQSGYFIDACELNLDLANHLNKSFPEVHLVGLDFLEFARTTDLRYAGIVMNPPFAGGRDVSHVAAAYRLLQDGGTLVAITSPGWEFRSDHKHTEFRSWIDELDECLVEEVPAGTFHESGTNVRAKLLVIKK